MLILAMDIKRDHVLCILYSCGFIFNKFMLIKDADLLCKPCLAANLSDDKKGKTCHDCWPLGCKSLLSSAVFCYLGINLLCYPGRRSSRLINAAYYFCAVPHLQKLSELVLASLGSHCCGLCKDGSRGRGGKSGKRGSAGGD